MPDLHVLDGVPRKAVRLEAIGDAQFGGSDGCRWLELQGVEEPTDQQEPRRSVLQASYQGRRS